MGIKYSVNESFFEKWSLEMAYTLGFLYADGSMEDAHYLRGKYIRVTSTDKEIVVKIKRWLKSEHKIVEMQPWQGRGKMRYFLRIGSKKMYYTLSALGFFPSKSQSMRLPWVPGGCISHFLRGYFDGDGCVYIETIRHSEGGRGLKDSALFLRPGAIFFFRTLKG